MPDSTPEALAEQLAAVDTQLAELHRQATALRVRNASRSDGALDAEELAATATSIQELDAVISALQARRDAFATQHATG